MDSRKDYVDTSIGKMPIDWTLSTIEDNLMILTDYHANGSYKKLKENVELFDTEDYAVMIRTTNFEQNDFSNNLKYISEHAYNFLSKSKVYKNDILMNKIANAGSVYLMPDIKKPVSLAMNLFLLRFNENINQQYAYYFLKYKEPYIKLNAAGTAAKTITKDSVRKFPLFIPPMKEQEKIVAVLNALSSKIELNNQMNQTLEEMAQALFKRWFVDFEFPNEEGQPYKSSGGEMVESELGMIPSIFRISDFANVVTTYNGYSYKGKELGDSNDAMVTIKNFDRKGGYKLEGLKEIILSDRVKPQHFVEVNDIIVAHTDLTQGAEIIGNPIMVLSKGKYEKLIMSMDTVKVKSKNKNISDTVVYLMLKDRRFKEFALAYTNGTTVLHLSKKAIPLYKFAKCENESIYMHFDSIVSPMFKLIAENITMNEELIELRDTLLPKLMSGEIRVSDLC